MYLWSADFVKRNKDSSVQEPTEGQIRVKGPWRHQQQDDLWQECCQAKPLAPPAVCTNKRKKKEFDKPQNAASPLKIKFPPNT